MQEKSQKAEMDETDEGEKIFPSCVFWGLPDELVPDIIICCKTCTFTAALLSRQSAAKSNLGGTPLMKKALALILAAAMSCSLVLTGCGGGNAAAGSASTGAAAADRQSVV